MWIYFFNNEHTLYLKHWYNFHNLVHLLCLYLAGNWITFILSQTIVFTNHFWAKQVCINHTLLNFMLLRKHTCFLIHNERTYRAAINKIIKQRAWNEKLTVCCRKVKLNRCKQVMIRREVFSKRASKHNWNRRSCGGANFIHLWFVEFVGE